ncbi:2Fe-2S iron-sulfur cluster-binding protein [Marinobacter sp. M1N3S26]|uniref:xanthine dehydrogenase family Fe-S subunit n=1 Tax=unclassified Marinobacter TaxID=83889 RepID=UPI00387AB1F6
MRIPVATINDESVDIAVEPRRNLADFLREDLHLTGTHIGCEQGICGACTVVRDGRPVRSCLTWAVGCDQSRIETIEAFDDDPLMARLRTAFSAEHALQCGFCTPGMLVTARDIVLRFAGQAVDDTRIRLELSGNLCRCTGYTGIVRAIQRVLRDVTDPGTTTPAPVPATLALPPLADIPLSDPATSHPQQATTRSQQEGNGRRVESTFALPHPAAEVWQRLSTDLTTVVACLPGAELTELREDGSLEGVFNVRLGPVSARIAGEGKADFDDASWQGQVEGRGKDSRSNSSARGSLSFTLEVLDDTRCRLTLALTFEMTGTLAQFSRGSLVDEIVGVLIEQFQDNFSALLSGEEAPRKQSLGLFRLLSMALRRWIRQLFSRR